MFGREPSKDSQLYKSEIIFKTLKIGWFNCRKDVSSQAWFPSTWESYIYTDNCVYRCRVCILCIMITQVFLWAKALLEKMAQTHVALWMKLPWKWAWKLLSEVSICKNNYFEAKFLLYADYINLIYNVSLFIWSTEVIEVSWMGSF